MATWAPASAPQFWSVVSGSRAASLDSRQQRLRRRVTERALEAEPRPPIIDQRIKPQDHQRRTTYVQHPGRMRRLPSTPARHRVSTLNRVLVIVRSNSLLARVHRLHKDAHMVPRLCTCAWGSCWTNAPRRMQSCNSNGKPRGPPQPSALHKRVHVACACACGPGTAPRPRLHPCH